MSSRELKQNSEAAVVNFLLKRAQEVYTNDRARFNRSVATTAGREKLFMEQLSDVLHEVFSKSLPTPKLKSEKSRGKTSRIINLILSDTHYGSCLDPREVGHKYGPIEEARRTSYILKQVANYKRDYRDDTELVVHLLGDLIQGQLHDMRDGLPLAEQVASCIRILVQAARFLASEFKKVTFRCTPGNHGRNTVRHRERAINQKWDSIETMIYIALKEASRFIPNVEVELYYSPEYYWSAFGFIGLGTHGDTVIKPGYPNKNIDVEGISRQVDKINNTRVMNGEEPLSVVIVGHVHVGSMTHLPSGAIVLTNGCLIPPDAYAKSIGIFSTACGQWIFESVEGHLVGDARFIKVGPTTDSDESLDSIIKPFTGL